MATHRITSPDGSVYNVTAPDGATDADVLSYVQSQHAPAPKAAAAPPMRDRGVVNAAQGGFLDAATLGLSDELTAGIAAIPRAGIQALRGRGFDVGKAYNDVLTQQRGMAKADDEAHPIARGAGQLAGAMILPGGAAAAGTRIIPRLAVNAAQGAAMGFGQGEGGLEARARSAGQGALLAAAGGELGRGAIMGASRVLAPRVAPAVRRLADAGVTMTPGQIMGGMAKTVEDKLSGTAPILGDAIAAARSRGVRQFSRAAVQEGLNPLGIRLPMNIGTQDAIGFAQQASGQALDAASQGMTAQADTPFTAAMAAIRQRAASGELAAPDAARLDQMLQNHVERHFDANGTMTGPGFQAARSELRRLATAYGADPSATTRELGTMLGEAGDHLEDSAARHSTPQAVDAFRRANQSYAMLTRNERAAASAAGAGASREAGDFVPGQLMTAVRQGDRSARKRATARGDALMQQLASDGVSVLPSRIGDAGTAGRLMVNGGAVGAGLLANPAATLGAGAGLGALSLPYSPLLAPLVQSLLINRSPAMLQAGRRVGQVAAPLGGALGLLGAAQAGR